MQLSDIRTRVRERLGLSTSDTAVTDAILTEFINAANRKIALMHDWPWLVATDATWTATVAGTDTYSPATDARKTIYIVVNNEQLLKYKQPQDLARWESTQGMPGNYTWIGNQIKLSPVPQGVYNIEHLYILEVATMSADGDLPEMATAADQWAVDALIEYAALLTAQRLRDAELIASTKEEWARTVTMLQDEIRRSKQLPTVMRRNDIGWP